LKLATPYASISCLAENPSSFSTSISTGSPWQSHVPAPHGLEAGIQVLEDAGPHVVQAGPTVGRGRTFVEDPRLAVLAGLADLLDDVVRAPAGEHARFQREEIEGVDGSERHGRPS
jgi:hypothetical protein